MHRLRVDNLRLNKSAGGLKYFDLTAKIHSFQAKWIYKYNSHKFNAQ